MVVEHFLCRGCRLRCESDPVRIKVLGEVRMRIFVVRVRVTFP